ncbi:hypothetical protein [Rickettsiella endosymbiont of Miltochrista miniata]|uniref:hypothetical protein n=1 Tax=Rickettsiella endosymbiont of Miltochrista miniata TaxID=3066239 RepID=UPI00313C674E
MPRFVSDIKKHITTTEFWRALSFVLKRLESIAKYLTSLPLPFTFSLYFLHLIRAALRIVSYFYKTKNKNLGDTCKLLFALFKVSIAVIAIVLLGCGLATLPAILLSSFFAYSILKLIHSAIVLLVSTVFYLKIDKNCIEQQWRRAQYRDNISKHVCMLGAGLLFVLLTCMVLAGTSILIWTNPLMLLVDGVICVALFATVAYFAYKVAKNIRTSGENSLLKKDQIAKIKKFLWMFGLGIIALLLTAATPWVGVSVITCALILLSAQDALLTIYYYFYAVYIPDPEPANLSEAQLNERFGQTSRDYYQNFSPIYYLQTQISEKFPQVDDVNKANKKLLLKVTLLKILQLRSKREKTAKLGVVNQFFSLEEKFKVKEEYLLRELAWTLNTDNLEDLIELILANSDLLENKRSGVLDDLELQKILGQLVFFAEQEKRTQRAEVVKPKLFYQSFWKKVGACEALSQAFRASRNIEEQVPVSNFSWEIG